MTSARRRGVPVIVALLGAGCVAVAVGASATSARPGTGVPAAVGSQPPAGTPLAQEIARTEQRLRAVPGDYNAWATLGFDEVQQAKITVDPTYYPKATAALAQSLRIDHTDNFVAMAGEAALAAARHDFQAALDWSHRGLRIDPRSAALYGTLTDALTQLGHYRAAAAAARHMELLSPGTPAEARLSYAAELRGNLSSARRFMRLALADAASANDVGFARYYLGDLALGAGHAAAALRQYRAGLAADPADVALREGVAKALAAAGHADAAVRMFRRVVNEVPQPTYVLEYGNLLQSLGRAGAAGSQWQLFRTEERLFRANGVTLDSDATLFEAEHGDPMVAVRLGRAAVRTRPFLDSHDAYGWALHTAGRNREALVEADRALRTGARNGLFYFHRGEIERSLGRTASARRDLAAALRIDPDLRRVST